MSISPPKLSRTSRLATVALLGLAITAPLNIGGGCSGKSVDIPGMVQGTGQLVQSASLSEADEPAMGEAVVCAVTNRYRLSSDEKLNKYVNLVGLAVASTCPNQDIEFSFAVLDTDEVNAFSGPAGFVMVT